jgi:hypothetical protein
MGTARAHRIASDRPPLFGIGHAENIGGPGTLTIYPDGSFLFDGQGHSALLLNPVQANTFEPGVFFTTGHLVTSADANGIAQTLTLSGQQTDGCALLS